MREINLDAANWMTPLDFYAALLPAIGAPEWHGNSIPAILDSMIGGEINAIDPPYVVKIHNLVGRPDPLVEEIEYAVRAVARRRASHRTRYDEDVDVAFEILG